MKSALDLWRGGALSGWDPFREISTLHRGINRLFEDMLTPVNEAMERTGFVPSCDVDETDTHYLMSFDLPGVKKDDVRIEVKDNQLIVSGERKDEKKDEKGKRVTERFYGSFQRAFTLPSNVDADKVEASYENGVLYLAVPKSEVAKLRQIQIGDKKPGLFGRLLGGRSEEKQEERKAG